jgi:tight adherence protein C
MTSTRVEDFKFEDWLPYWLSPNDLIAFLAALAVLVAFLAVWQALRPQDPFTRRYLQVVQRRETLRQQMVDTRRSRQRVTAAGFMNEIVTRLNLLRSQHAHDARMLLAQAGLRSNEAMIRYLFARLAMPFVFGAVVLADSYGAQMLPIPEKFRMIAALVAAVLGFFAPGVLVKNFIKKRAHQMELGLPDALDLLVICAEAGLSLDAALQRVARELELTWPELSEEFGITAAELTYLPDRKQAFENLNARTNMVSVRGVVNTLLQTAKFGTPLAQSLRILAAEFREARLIRAEEKAARLPAMLTVPMILFILPTLFIMVLGPAGLSIADTFSKKGSITPATSSTSTGAGGGGGSGSGDKIVTLNEKPDAAGATGPDGQTLVDSRGVPVPTAPRETVPTEAQVVPVRVIVRVGDLVPVDVDARALRKGSQLRLNIVPIGTAEALGDVPEFERTSVAVLPDRVRVALPARAEGPSELRLYYVPPAGSNRVIAARHPITVTSAN